MTIDGKSKNSIIKSNPSEIWKLEFHKHLFPNNRFVKVVFFLWAGSCGLILLLCWINNRNHSLWVYVLDTHRIALNVNKFVFLSRALILINFHINKSVNVVARGEGGKTLSYEPSLVIAAVRSPRRRMKSKAAETPLKSNVSKTWNSITIMKYNDGFK